MGNGNIQLSRNINEFIGFTPNGRIKPEDLDAIQRGEIILASIIDDIPENWAGNVWTRPSCIVTLYYERVEMGRRFPVGSLFPQSTPKTRLQEIHFGNFIFDQSDLINLNDFRELLEQAALLKSAITLVIEVPTKTIKAVKLWPGRCCKCAIDPMVRE